MRVGRPRCTPRAVTVLTELKIILHASRHARSCGCWGEWPRRISLGFAHSAAAVGERRRVIERTCPRSLAVKVCRAEGPAQIGRRTLTFTHVCAVIGGEGVPCGRCRLAGRLAGGLAGRAGGRPGWRADGGEGSRMYIFTTKNRH